MQLPLIRSSSESTAAVTKLAKPMFVMKRPRLSTCSIGSPPSCQSTTRTLPPSRPVSTPTYGIGSVRQNAPREVWRSSPGCAGRVARHVVGACSGVPRSWIGASARWPARLQVAAPASTHASSNADERERQVLRAVDEAALFRIQVHGRHAGVVERL